MSRRVILDECLPRKLKRVLGNESVQTAHEAGLSGMKNGRLIAAIQGNFDVFVTVDKSLRHKQNLSTLSFGIVLIRVPSNAIEDLLPLATALRSAIAGVSAGNLIEVSGY
ncbi:hypothetical protein OKA05_17165 [Luteolibacter arcticus]|uniref:DUF5615 domain-containing protein n=1 Tax=Luteolibacter arcticus TaxID=1581411 RepID=A0ABT3GL96_9BACT|nr:hypothetical protein [Luteolibacter arcticus]MCW1924299.1 hypothetical protein [Luteolibacter arcticus]